MSVPYPTAQFIFCSPVNLAFSSANAKVAGQNFIGAISVSNAASGASTFIDAKPPARNSNGEIQKFFVNDFYYRIHIEPVALDLGNILSVQTRDISVWNANFTSSQLNSVSIPNETGISFSQPVSAPYTLNALEELKYQVSVAVDGAPSFDVVATWTIDSKTYSVEVKGNRVIVWPFSPNWTNPLNENLEWRTGILTAFDGTEQRYQIRSKPRRKISYDVLIQSDNASQLRNLMLGWQNRQYALPNWMDKSRLTAIASIDSYGVPVDTTNRGFAVGKLGIIIKDTLNYEVFEIESITDSKITTVKPLQNTWGKRIPVYPINLAMLSSQSPVSLQTGRVATATLDWSLPPVNDEPNIPNVAATDTVNGVEIVYRKPNWITPVQYETDFGYDILDANTGAIDQIQTVKWPQVIHRAQWLLKNKSDISDFKAFLGRLKGRFAPVLMPTWLFDFTLESATSKTSTSIKVKTTGFSQMGDPGGLQKAVLIRMKDKSMIVKNITGASESPDKTYEVISFDSSIGTDLTLTNVAMISLVYLFRMTSDGVTLNYQTDSVATVEMNMTAVKA